MPIIYYKESYLHIAFYFLIVIMYLLLNSPLFTSAVQNRTEMYNNKIVEFSFNMHLKHVGNIIQGYKEKQINYRKVCN